MVSVVGVLVGIFVVLVSLLGVLVGIFGVLIGVLSILVGKLGILVDVLIDLVGAFITSDRSSYSDSGLLYVRSGSCGGHFLRFRAFLPIYFVFLFENGMQIDNN